jgi:hypothetical protein
MGEKKENLVKNEAKNFIIKNIFSADEQGTERSGCGWM